MSSSRNSPRDDDAANRATVPPPHSGNSSVDFEHLVPALRTPVSVPLGRLEMTVFSRIDGRRSVNDIASEIGLTPFEVLRILERLMQLVPDLTVGQQEVVELSVDELWDEGGVETTTAEVPAKPR